MSRVCESDVRREEVAGPKQKKKRSRVSWDVVPRGIRRVYLVAYSPLTRVHLIPIYRVFGNENYSASTGVVYTKLLTWLWSKNKKHGDKDIIQTSCMRVQLNYQVIRKKKKRIILWEGMNTWNYRYMLFSCFFFVFICFGFLFVSARYLCVASYYVLMLYDIFARARLGVCKFV